jgi:hypothetical protein
MRFAPGGDDGRLDRPGHIGADRLLRRATGDEQGHRHGKGRGPTEVTVAATASLHRFVSEQGLPNRMNPGV